MGTLVFLFQMAMVCATILAVVFMIVLAMPQSKMRDVVKYVIIAIGCGLYILCPIDFVPEAALGPIGLLDDGAALIGAIAAWKTAMKASHA
jgi:uncharacterized membrane protein YkvA (DUF1232 family)